MKIAVIFYSTYGHIYQMAQSVVKGVRQAGGEANLLRVEETLPSEVLEKMGALEAQKAFEKTPIATVGDLETYDGFIFAFPTRFGNMPAQFKAFVDATGGLWQKGSLIGKPFALVIGSATQHGGQESTLLSSMIPFIHHGMLFVGIPASEEALFGTDEVSGGSFYGSTTLAGGDGSRLPSEKELYLASALGERVARIAGKLM